MLWSHEVLFLLNQLEVVLFDIFNHKDINSIVPVKQKKKESAGINRYVNLNYKARRRNVPK
jgi:hypothetical protein